VRTAVSLSEAGSMVEHATPDLMLLDLGLPDGDGAALLQRVRLTHNFPVLVVSARHQEAQKCSCWMPGLTTIWSSPSVWQSC